MLWKMVLADGTDAMGRLYLVPAATSAILSFEPELGPPVRAVREMLLCRNWLLMSFWMNSCWRFNLAGQPGVGLAWPEEVS